MSTAFVATFVVPASRADLSDAALQRAKQAAPNGREIRWLHDGVAADMTFEADADDIAVIRETLETAAREIQADALVQPLATRAKKLLIADMDSTLIGQECIDELAAAVGIGSRVAAITERAMRGEIEGALRERVALLAGLPLSVIDDLLANRITLNAGARTVVQTMRAHGGYVAIVSGGFTPFTSAIARRVGADEQRANRLESAEGKLTGRVAEPILGAGAKLATLRELTAKLGLQTSQTLGVGDGANDLPMLTAAGFGVAYRAKPKVAAAAAARVDYADLTALLYAQGLRGDEFVNA
jgi:phosphoserine phosphatase